LQPPTVSVGRTLRLEMPSPSLVCAVDGDEALGESLDGLLRSAGFGVRTFLSADTFLECSASNEADCLIVDYAMPGMDGLELEKALRDRGQHVSPIFATAIAREYLWNQLTSSGAFAVFARPLDAEDLLDANLVRVSSCRSGRAPSARSVKSPLTRRVHAALANDALLARIQGGSASTRMLPQRARW
jgi:FixJ family two-component response regulator